MGNGSVGSGDGSRYLGRGPGQLTGHDNYAACGKAIGYDLIAQPELAERRDVGALAFGWFWNEGNRTGRSLNLLAEALRFTELRHAVNGGANGLDECLALTRHNLKEVFV
jgi:putative chitinase